MFGLTKREQRWKAQQQAAELLVGFVSTVVQAEAQARASEASGEAERLRRENAELRAELVALKAAPATDWETRAELAEQQVVSLAEERDHYRALCLTASKAATPAENAALRAASAPVTRKQIYEDQTTQAPQVVGLGDASVGRLAVVSAESEATESHLTEASAPAVPAPITRERINELAGKNWPMSVAGRVSKLIATLLAERDEQWKSMLAASPQVAAPAVPQGVDPAWLHFALERARKHATFFRFDGDAQFGTWHEAHSDDRGAVAFYTEAEIRAILSTIPAPESKRSSHAHS